MTQISCVCALNGCTYCSSSKKKKTEKETFAQLAGAASRHFFLHSQTSSFSQPQAAIAFAFSRISLASSFSTPAGNDVIEEGEASAGLSRLQQARYAWIPSVCHHFSFRILEMRRRAGEGSSSSLRPRHGHASLDRHHSLIGWFTDRRRSQSPPIQPTSADAKIIPG